MEFIRKHTDGPLCFDGNDIMNKNGRLIIDCDNIKPYDMNAMVMVPDMINYMVERAEYIFKILYDDYGYPMEGEPKEECALIEYRSFKTELSRILEILRAAGG